MVCAETFKNDDPMVKFSDEVLLRPDVEIPEGKYTIESRELGTAYGRPITYRKGIVTTFFKGVGVAVGAALLSTAVLTFGLGPYIVGVAGSLITIPMFSMFKKNMLELSDKNPPVVFTVRHTEGNGFALETEWKTSKSVKYFGKDNVVDQESKATTFYAKPGRLFPKVYEAYLRAEPAGKWLCAGKSNFLRNENSLLLRRNKPSPWKLVPHKQ